MTKINLPHINRGTDYFEIPIGLRKGFSKTDQAYDKENSDAYLSGLNDYIETDAGELPTFWYFKTKKQYNILSEETNNFLKYFSAELVKIISDNSGIIKFPAGISKKIKAKCDKNLSNKRIKSKYPKYVEKVIDGELKEWKGKVKISDLLIQEAYSSKVDYSNLFDKNTAYLSTFSLSDKKEQDILKEKLMNKIKEKNLNIYQNDSFGTITVYNPKPSDLIDLSEIGFIDFIDPVLKMDFSVSSSQTPDPNKPQISSITSQSLNNICVLDSGVSGEIMKENIRRETLVTGIDDISDDTPYGHGTLVSSVAMFGNKSIGHEAILKPKSNVISYNIWRDGKTTINLLDAIDMAYLSRKNLQIIVDNGAIPYIPYKSNSLPKKKGSMVWAKMFQYCKEKPQEFFEHYHKRSNVETTFSVIKQKFGKDVMSRNFTSQTNEVLLKILCHNICCLISAYFEKNIENYYSTNPSQSEVILRLG